MDKLRKASGIRSVVQLVAGRAAPVDAKRYAARRFKGNRCARSAPGLARDRERDGRGADAEPMLGVYSALEQKRSFGRSAVAGRIRLEALRGHEARDQNGTSA